MKKFLLVSVSGILVGGIFAAFMFKNIEKEAASVISPDTMVTAFQVGVFSVYDNAIKMQANFNNSYVYRDSDKYRVFIAIYQHPDIINKLQKYYHDNNINVYLKEINASASFVNELNKYENLLKETDDIEIYENINKNILEDFNRQL